MTNSILNFSNTITERRGDWALVVGKEPCASRDLALATIATGLAFFAADFSAAPGLGHRDTPFQSRAGRKSIAGVNA
jgi:hypothetical protein